MTTDNRLTYGGQAVIEGVLIRGQRCASVAVRRPNGTIAHRTDPINPFFTGLFRRVPLVRGIIALIEMLSLGMRSLVYSANVGIEEEEEEIVVGTGAAASAALPQEKEKDAFAKKEEGERRSTKCCEWIRSCFCCC